MARGYTQRYSGAEKSIVAPYKKGKINMMKHFFYISTLLASCTLLARTFEEHFNQAVQLVHQEKTLEAIAALEQAAALNPTHAPTFFNMGVIYKALGNLDKAQENLEHAIKLNPSYTRAFSYLGSLYATQNRIDDAIKCYETLVALDTRSVSMHDFFNLALWYTQKEQYAHAETWYKKILAITPDQKDATYNLACILRYAGNFQESRRYYQTFLEKTPDHAHARYGYAECCLALGDYEHGWQAFEARWKRDKDTRRFAEKLWDGSSLHNKTIVLRAEYGLGDTIQFLRYAPLLKEQGATVILEAQHSLIPLLSLCPYIDQIIPVHGHDSVLPAHDFQVPIMSLPYYFKTTLATIPTNIPYLKAPPFLIPLWAQKLKDARMFKIGVCWEGSPYYEQFKSSLSKKSIPLAAFAPIATIANVQLYSLQKMNGTEQLQALPAGMHVYDFGPNFDHDNGRFMDTASVIQHLDLIICTDTSVAHLAGALGKPVWVLLPKVADWRWMIDRSDCPWYPSMRLFRQPEKGRWDLLLNHVAQELKDMLEKKQRTTQSAIISAKAEVQIGELIDKITILQIKKERIKDPAKIKNIDAELTVLLNTYEQEIPHPNGIEKLWQSLKETNAKLWVIEDEIRDKERARCFDQEFIQLARSVYYTNDERCRIKRDINMLTGSRLMEEKSYTAY